MKTFIEQYLEAIDRSRSSRRGIRAYTTIEGNQAVHDYWFLRIRRLENLAKLNPSRRDSITRGGGLH